MVSDTVQKSEIKKESIFLSRYEIGTKLEDIGFQMTVCTFLYLDIVAFIFLYVAETSIDVTDESIEIIPSLITSFLNFTLFGFSLELLSLGCAFGFSLFHHLGYILDIIVLTTIVYNQFYDWSPYPLRFLMVFRMWRLFRLVHSWVQLIQVQAEEYASKLASSRQIIKQLEKNIGHMEDSMMKEKKVREGLERRLQTCREEIETLNEALQIAAKDVATLQLENKDILVAEERTEVESDNQEALFDAKEVKDPSDQDICN